MIDHFSKCAEVVPVYTKDMSTIIHLVDKFIVEKYCTPKVILTDNGKEFINRVCGTYAKNKNIIWKFGSPYKPTTTGLIERFNRTLGSKLRKITEFGKYDWAKCSRKAQRAYMHSFHRAIGCSSIELIQGTVLNTMDIQEGVKLDISKEEFLLRAKDNLKNYRLEYSSRCDKYGKEKEIEVGDKVWYKLILQQGGKLDPKWQENGTVLEKKYNSYKIIMEEGRTVIASRDHLKIYKGR